MKCSICEYEFSEFPSNPFPFSGIACCTDCDDRFVTPVRMLYIEDDAPLLNILQFIAKHGAQLVREKKEFKNVLDGSNS